MKSTLLNMTAVLFGITLIASAGVGAVNMITAEPIAQAEQAAKTAALNGVLPAFDETAAETLTIDEMPITVYTATKGGQVAGYAVESMTKNGFGGAIKNLAMGCAPQAGKIDQHGRNVVIYPKCIGCGQCVPLCPRNALSLEKAEKGRHAVIDKERCIGCYECVTACKQGAIGVDTPNEYSDFAERMAEYAYGAVKGKEGRICYLNFLLNVTPQCDCAGWSEPAIVPDLGILASEDPVALDTACFELVKEAHSLIPLGEHGAHSCGYDKFSALHPNTRGWHQVEYAESIGMGSRDYELITV